MVSHLHAQPVCPSIWGKRFFCSSLLVLLVAACGGGGGTSPPAASALPTATAPTVVPTTPTPAPPPAPAPETAQTIGAAGGTVAGPDGVQLNVSPGTIDAPVTFRIARDGEGAPELIGLNAVSPVYSVTPHGQGFEGSARISIPLSAAQLLPAGAKPLLLKAEPGGKWRIMQNVSDDPSRMAVDVDGLSYYVVGSCTSISPTWTIGAVDCPGTDHKLELVFYDGQNGSKILVGTGVNTPAWYVTDTPQNLLLNAFWTRPSGTNRTDQLSVVGLPGGFNSTGFRSTWTNEVVDVGPSFGSFGKFLSVTIDPARVPGANTPNGKMVRVRAYASYSATAFRIGQGNVATGFEFQVDFPILVRYSGPQPTISQQPADRSVTDGQSPTFTVAASVASTTPLSYQWSRRPNVNGTFTTIGGATSPSHIVAGAQLADNGAQFQVEVCAGPSRCVTSNPATLTVTPVVVVPPPPPANTVPTFSVQPADVSVVNGQTASFTAVATGLPLPQIKWQRTTGSSGTFSDVTGVPACGTTHPSAGATNVAATCTVGPLAIGDTGQRYRAIAVNVAAPAGVQSGVATVTVSAAAVAPTITLQPTPQTTTVGASATFSVGATGTAPLNYLWKINGNDLTPSFTFSNCIGSFTQSAGTATLAGLSAGCDGLGVSVLVTNGVGPGASSNPATLTVNPAVVPLTATQIVAGQEWSMVLRPDRSVWAWGSLHRTDGTVQIANLPQANQAQRPVRMYPAVLSDVRAISGWFNSFWALKGAPGTTASRVVHWGIADAGSDGRGGDGNGSIGSSIATRYNEAAPVEVLERVNNVAQPVDRVCSIAGGPGRLTMIRAIDSAGLTTDCNAGSAKTVWFVGSLRSRGYESIGVAFAMPGLPTNSPPAVIFNGQTTSGSPGLAIALDDGRVFGLGDNPFGGFGVPAGGGFPIGDLNGPVLLPASWGNARGFGMSFSYSLFVLRADGSVMTSGRDNNGEMGLGSAPGGNVAGPVPVLAESCVSLPCASVLTGVTSIASNYSQVTLALKNGQILGWGQRNAGGLRGLNDTTDQPFPRAVPSAVSGFTALSASYAHALVIGPANVVYAWGSGLRGALGDGVNGGTRTEPMMVTLP